MEKILRQIDKFTYMQLNTLIPIQKRKSVDWFHCFFKPTERVHYSANVDSNIENKICLPLEEIVLS